MRFFSARTDSRATASSPGAIDVSAGDRYCESSELSKPITEMSSGIRRSCIWIECITPEASMSLSATTPSGRTPESSSMFIAATPSLRCHMIDGTTSAGSNGTPASSSASRYPRNRNAAEPTSSPGCTPTTATRLHPVCSRYEVARLAPSTFSVAMWSTLSVKMRSPMSTSG